MRNNDFAKWALLVLAIGTIISAQSSRANAATLATIKQSQVIGLTASLNAKAKLAGDPTQDFYGKNIYSSGNIFVGRDVDEKNVFTVDSDGNTTASGNAKAAGYLSSDGTAGATEDVTVRDAAGTGTTVLHFKNGLYVGKD